MVMEPVAVDYMGVGERGSTPSGSTDGSEERVRLVRPIPSVPENRGGQSRRSPAPEGGRSFVDRDVSPFAQGLRQQAWNRLPLAARFQSEEDNSGRVILSPKREMESSDGPLLAHHPSLSAWDNSAPASPSHHPAASSRQYEEFMRVQQVRKVAAMYASHQQASRGAQNAARTSPLRDEAQRGSQPLDRTGPEHLATQPHSPANQSGFGSPTPFYGRMKQSSAENGGAMAGKRPPFQQHPFQAGNLPRPAGSGKQLRTAQLTIFYAGMVNVYDDVPSDKAQAIMLLASGNTWSSTNMSRPGSFALGRPFAAPAAVPQPSLSAPGSPASQAPTTSAAVPPRPMVPGVVFSNVRQPPVTNVELPQARKASLARFLEKRKDRVRKVPVKTEGEASPSRDKSPSLSSGKPSARSPSPTPAALDRGSSPGGLGHPSRGSNGDEPNSPNGPPQTPPRQSMSEEKCAGTSKRRDYEIEQDSNKRARRVRSPSGLSVGSATEHALDEDLPSR